MIGYLAWSRILTKAATDSTFKPKLKGQWRNVKNEVKKMAHKKADTDGGDEKIWRVRYLTAMDSGLPIAEQIFFDLTGALNVRGLVNILTCPNDCISKPRLNVIGGFIVDGAKKYSAATESNIVAKIIADIIHWAASLTTPLTESEEQQLAKIVANIGQSNIDLDIPPP